MRIKLNKKWCLLLGISPIPALIPLFGTISCGSNQVAGDPVLYDDLPKNYSVNQYRTAIENYRKTVSQMTKEQMVTEAISIKKALEKLNNTVYDGLEPFFNEKILDEIREENPDLPPFSKNQAQTIYNFLPLKQVINFFRASQKFIEIQKIPLIIHFSLAKTNEFLKKQAI